MVAAAPTSVDLYPVGGGLDARTRANVRTFAERYRRYGAGAVMILTPAGTNPELDRRLRDPPGASRGGRQRQVAVGAYLPPNDAAAPPVRVSSRA